MQTSWNWSFRQQPNIILTYKSMNSNFTKRGCYAIIVSMLYVQSLNMYN